MKELRLNDNLITECRRTVFKANALGQYRIPKLVSFTHIFDEHMLFGGPDLIRGIYIILDLLVYKF